MNYETEGWYKLYIRESTEDRLLPVFDRALRDFLLRLAKSRSDGTILSKTQNPGEDIARALNAHPSEVQLVLDHVASMLRDGYLTHRKGRLWITNFVAAQAQKSAGARRQKAYRERRKVSTGDVTGDALVTSQEIRSEKIRSEPKRVEESHAPATPTMAVVRDPEPEAAPERELSCPPDLLSRPGVVSAIRELAENLPCPIASLEAEAREFVSYWTLGKGMGRTRLNWPKELRERLRKRFHEGSLQPPGAVEHDRYRSRVRHVEDRSERPMSAETAKLLGPEIVRELEHRRQAR